MDKVWFTSLLKKFQLIDKIAMKLSADKIYILPTRHGLAFLVALFFLFLIALSYGHSMAFAATFFMTSLLMSSALLTHLNLKNVKLVETYIPEVFRENDCKNIRVKIFNEGERAKLSVSALKWNNQKLDHSSMIDLKKKQIGFLELKRPSLILGRHKLENLTLMTSFPLGLFYTWKKSKQAQIFYVAPSAKNHLLDKGISKKKIAQEKQNGSLHFTDEGDFYEHDSFIEYSDSWKKVDWKVYARKDHLLKKKHAHHQDEVITLDYHETLLLKEDQRLEQLSFWIEVCVCENREFHLRLPHKTYSSLKAQDGENVALKALAEMSTSTGRDL